MNKHNHKSEHDEIVKSVIKRIAKNKIANIVEVNYQIIKKMIIDGDQTMTVLFWYALYENPIYTKYDKFDYCHCCKKFNMY